MRIMLSSGDRLVEIWRMSRQSLAQSHRGAITLSEGRREFPACALPVRNLSVVLISAHAPTETHIRTGLRYREIPKECD